MAAMKIKKTGEDYAIIGISYLILFLFALITFFPFINVVCKAFSEEWAVVSGQVGLLPVGFQFDTMKYVVSSDMFLNAFKMSLIVTVLGTLLGVFMKGLVAYPLSRSGFRGKKIFMSLIIFTMLFNGGLIPNFYLIRSLHLLDTRWALIFPRLLSAFNIILLINFFQSLPVSLLEAAKLDGAGEWKVLYQIVLPLSKPIMATLALFVAVGYIRATDRWTLQLVLREIVMSSNTQMLQTGGNLAELGKTTSESLKYATLIVAIVPIMCVYPFLQKYFTQGVMVGAVKG